MPTRNAWSAVAIAAAAVVGGAAPAGAAPATVSAVRGCDTWEYEGSQYESCLRGLNVFTGEQANVRHHIVSVKTWRDGVLVDYSEHKSHFVGDLFGDGDLRYHYKESFTYQGSVCESSASYVFVNGVVRVDEREFVCTPPVSEE